MVMGGQGHTRFKESYAQSGRINPRLSPSIVGPYLRERAPKFIHLILKTPSTTYNRSIQSLCPRRVNCRLFSNHRKTCMSSPKLLRPAAQNLFYNQPVIILHRDGNALSIQGSSTWATLSRISTKAKWLLNVFATRLRN